MSLGRLGRRFADFVEGQWIVRRWADGEEERYQYIGAFAPSEPFLAVYYVEEDDALETEPVYAFVVRVKHTDRLHLVELLPLVCREGFLENAAETANFVGVVPAQSFAEMRDFFMEEGRMKAKMLDKKRAQER